MKNIAKKTIVFIATACVLNTDVVAQTLIPPSGFDQLWVTATSGIINGLNTALIDYPIAAQRYGQIAACAHGGVMGTGSPYNGVEVTDLTYGITSISVPYPAGTYDMASTPDVIIGDSIGAMRPGAEYIMAVTFVNTNTPPDIEIDYFNISLSAPGVFTVAYHSSEYLPYIYSAPYVFPFSYPLGTVHIDVVAESDNKAAYGLPQCDKFFVTFDAADGPTSGDVYDIFGAYGSLTSYSTTVTTTDITSSFHVADNWQPDVAGIQLTGSPSAVDVGIFTWVNQANHEIYTSTWDPASGTTFSNFTWTSTINDPYTHPRIDANDDHYSNSAASNSNFKIVTEHYNSGVGNTDVASYDFGPGGSGVLISAWPLAATGIPYNIDNYAPAVAFGPSGPNGSQYMITEVVQDPGPTFVDNYLSMMPVDMIDPTVISPDPSSVLNVYIVNNTSGTPLTPMDAGPTRYANAVSTPCNNVTDTSLVTWAAYDAPDYKIWYKRSGYDWGGTGHYYRPGEPLVCIADMPDPIVVRPNPATTRIEVNALGKYYITNMLGQALQNGELFGGNNSIDIQSLANGQYIITLAKDGEKPVVKRFTKN